MASTPESTLHTRRRAASSRSGLGRELSYLNFSDCLCLAGAWNVFLWLSSMWVNSNCKISSVLCGKATIFQHLESRRQITLHYGCIVSGLQANPVLALCKYNTR
jgi:hypothetical protein